MLVARTASCHVANLCIFDQIKANVAKIQPENRQHGQKKHFLRNAPGVNGLTMILMQT